MAKAPNGRKLRDFDKNVFEGLCQIQCTTQEIESVFHADQRTVNRWCQRIYDKTLQEMLVVYKDHGKASLRRYQFNLSKTNPSMAIWLGKQWLGQKDVPQEIEQFNGKLSLLLDAIMTLKAKEQITEKIDTKEAPWFIPLATSKLSPSKSLTQE